jgi:DNA-binding transcriptional MerR regulator
MAARGRKALEAEVRLLERIEGLMAAGMKPSSIRDALASPSNPEPIELSLRQVQAHVKHIRDGWAKPFDDAFLAEKRGELLMYQLEVIRAGLTSSARYRDALIGVGYLNATTRGVREAERLLGLDVARAAAAPSPMAAFAEPHSLDELTPDEHAVRLRELAAAIEEAR